MKDALSWGFTVLPTGIVVISLTAFWWMILGGKESRIAWALVVAVGMIAATVLAIAEIWWRS